MAALPSVPRFPVQTRACRSSRGAHADSRGSAILETAIILPLVLLIIAGIMNFGSLEWQLQQVADSVRHGARVGANRSNVLMPCSQVVSESVMTATQCLASSKIGTLSWWGAPTGSVVSADWDGLNLKFVKVAASTNGSKSCLFCFSGLMDAITVSVESSFALEGNCT